MILIIYDTYCKMYKKNRTGIAEILLEFMILNRTIECMEEKDDGTARRDESVWECVVS